MQRVADLCDVFRRGRIIAITRISDQAIAGAKRKDDLREVRREGDYAIDLRGQDDVSSGIVDDLLCSGSETIRFWNGRARQSRQQPKRRGEPGNLFAVWW